MAAANGAFLGWPPSIQDVLHVASRDPAAELRGPLQELQHLANVGTC